MHPFNKTAGILSPLMPRTLAVNSFVLDYSTKHRFSPMEWVLDPTKRLLDISITVVPLLDQCSSLTWRAGRVVWKVGYLIGHLVASRLHNALWHLETQQVMLVGELPAQFQIDFFMSCNQSVWYLQQQNCTISISSMQSTALAIVYMVCGPSRTLLANNLEWSNLPMAENFSQNLQLLRVTFSNHGKVSSVFKFFVVFINSSHFLLTH